MDKTLFYFTMKRNNDTTKAICHDLGIARSTLYAKLDNRYPFSVAEICFFRARWQLTSDETSKIFLG